MYANWSTHFNTWLIHQHIFYQFRLHVKPVISVSEVRGSIVPAYHENALVRVNTIVGKRSNYSMTPQMWNVFVRWRPRSQVISASNGTKSGVRSASLPIEKREDLCMLLETYCLCPQYRVCIIQVIIQIVIVHGSLVIAELESRMMGNYLVRFGERICVHMFIQFYSF